MLPGSLKIVFSSFKKQIHHNPKIRAYNCGIWHSDEKQNLSQLDIAADEVKFYTDSQIFLHYLQNESRKRPVSITNFLNEIHLQSKFTDWNFVSGNRSLVICTLNLLVSKRLQKMVFGQMVPHFYTMMI